MLPTDDILDILATMYDNRNYWDLGLCPSACIIKDIREYNILETGSISFLR
jgi:hypothetical protein